MCTFTPLHYLIPLVTLQIWIIDVKYNKHLNQSLFTPGVNSQATLQYTMYIIYTQHIIYYY